MEDHLATRAGQSAVAPGFGQLVASEADDPPLRNRLKAYKAISTDVSVVKFCEVSFRLKPVHARDAALDDMSDCCIGTESVIDGDTWRHYGRRP
jgi:hypothetical protein